MYPYSTKSPSFLIYLTTFDLVPAVTLDSEGWNVRKSSTLAFLKLNFLAVYTKKWKCYPPS
jgi:hypothetical protein